MADITLTVGGDTRPLAAEINKLRKKKLDLDLGGLSSYKNPLGRITGNLGEFEKALEASNARVIAFGASAGALFAVQKGLRAIVESSIDVEKRLSDINVILNVSGKSLEKFSNNLFAVARNTGSAFADVADAATELSRQGLSVEETLQRTSDALILTRLSGMKAEESVNALTAALNSFSRAALNSTEYVSKLAAVDAAFAVSSEDLAKAISRVGSSAQDAGLGIDELIAAVTAAQQVTARGGAVIGNSFKTIFTRIQRPRVLRELENLGIAVHDMAGNVKPAMQVLKSLAVQFDNLSASNRASVAELVGGVFQVNVLKASLRDLSKEFSLYGNALDISNAATDEAVRRNEELNKTVSATLNSTVQNLTNFGSQIGSMTFGPAITKVLGGINNSIENFDLKSPKSMGEKIGAGVLGGIGKFLEGPGLLVIGVTLVKTFGRVAKQMTDAFKTIAGIGQANQAQIQSQQKILQLLGQNPAILAKIESEEMSIAAAHREILHLIDLETRALKNEVGIVKQLSTLLTSAGVKVTPTLGGGTALATDTDLMYQGYIPNFNKDKAAKNKELASASYAKKGTKAVKDSMPGIGTYYRNTAEEKISGSKTGHEQDWINPPASSAEGKTHRINAIRQTGIDPYKLNSGFIPNFATDEETAVVTAAMQRGAMMQAIARRMPGGVLIPDAEFAGQPVAKLPGKSEGAQKYRTGKETAITFSKSTSDKFNKSVEQQYKNAISNAAIDTFGSINASPIKLDKVGFSPTRGRMFEDMVQMLGGGSGAGSLGVDMPMGLAAVEKKQGSAFLDKHFSGHKGLVDKPIEVRSSAERAKKAKLSSKAVTDMVTANQKVLPFHPNIHFEAMNYLGERFVAGDRAVNLGELNRQQTKTQKFPAITPELIQNVKSSGYVPNFKKNWNAIYERIVEQHKKTPFESQSELAAFAGFGSGAAAVNNVANPENPAARQPKLQLGEKKYKNLQKIIRSSTGDRGRVAQDWNPIYESMVDQHKKEPFNSLVEASKFIGVSQPALSSSVTEGTAQAAVVEKSLGTKYPKYQKFINSIKSKNRGAAGHDFEEAVAILGNLKYEKNADALDFSKAAGRRLDVDKEDRLKIGMRRYTFFGDAHVRDGHSFEKMLDKVLSDIDKQKKINYAKKVQNGVLNVNKLDPTTTYFDITGEGQDSSITESLTQPTLERSDGISERARKVLAKIPRSKGRGGTKLQFTHHKDAINLNNLSKGLIPNFATGLYDSDRLASGVNRNSIIDAIVASGKPMHVFHGPAGGGKTTAAMKRYPNAQLVTSLEQIAALNDFAVVSGTNRSKKSGEYSARAQQILNNASKITAVIPARSDLMSRRFGRAAKGPAAGDKRDQKGIEGTLRAPGTDYRLYADLKKQGKNVEVLRNEGFVPNFGA